MQFFSACKDYGVCEHYENHLPEDLAAKLKTLR